ncbi:uncharacterized protein BDV17DRAFT_295500 [Aspergillus undulatus]|uniref:uncharacterized protein n=1 Tax=Aspergillus undulatus TaxID=1810928 RepID=UPI003CCCBF81
MASLYKRVLREGKGLTPNFADKVECKFWDLKAAGECIRMHQTKFGFSSAGHAYSVLLEVIGVQHGLSNQTMNILKRGFEFFIRSLQSMQEGESAQLLIEDIEEAGKRTCVFSLSVELMEVIRRPEGFAPVSSDRQPRPEDNAEGAAPVFLDLGPSF